MALLTCSEALQKRRVPQRALMLNQMCTRRRGRLACFGSLRAVPQTAFCHGRASRPQAEVHPAGFQHGPWHLPSAQASPDAVLSRKTAVSSESRLPAAQGGVGPLQYFCLQQKCISM